MQEHYWSKEVQHISEKYYIRDLYQLKWHIQRHKAVTCDLDKKDHCTKGHCFLHCGRFPNLLNLSRTFSIWSRSWPYFKWLQLELLLWDFRFSRVWIWRLLLLGCKVVSFGRRLSTFCWNILKMEAGYFFWIGSYILYLTASQPGRQ
jgi:hypothetical protein